MDILSIIIGIAVGLALGFGIAKFLEKNNVSNLIKNAKKEASSILKEANSEGESIKKDNKPNMPRQNTTPILPCTVIILLVFTDFIAEQMQFIGTNIGKSAIFIVADTNTIFGF